jgi:aldehyde dehydrogenase (NAD+)
VIRDAAGASPRPHLFSQPLFRRSQVASSLRESRHDEPISVSIRCATRAFLSDATKSYEWRIDQLDRMERMLLDNEDALCAALYQDFGKPPFEQLFEITVPSGVINYYRKNLRELMAPQHVELPNGLETTGNRGVIYKEPYGVTLVIGPFNAPILLLLDPAIAALATGNPVILKPANTTPATAALLSKLIPQYFAPENVAIVTGGREEIGELLALPFDFIFFTGSSAVGKVVMRAAAEIPSRFTIAVRCKTALVDHRPPTGPETHSRRTSA